MNFHPVLRKASEIGVGLTAIATLILAGCGGGGGSSGGSAGAGPNMTTLSISPSLGRFKEGSRVRIKDKNGAEIGTGTTNASGVASIAVATNSAAPLLVEAGINGDFYFDEKLGIDVAISGISSVGIRALVPDHTAVSQVGVTALTEIAVGSLATASGVLPSNLSAASAVGANTAVEQSFGITNLLLPPKLIDSVSAVQSLGSTTEAEKYAVALAGLANMAGTGANENALTVAHRLRDNLNGIAGATPASSVQAVVNAFKAAVSTASGVPSATRTTINAQITAPVLTTVKLSDLVSTAGNNAQLAQTKLLTQKQNQQPTQSEITQAYSAAMANYASAIKVAFANGTSITTAASTAQTNTDAALALQFPITITAGAGTSTGKVCVADMSYMGTSIVKACYTNLPSNFTCSQTGITSGGATLQGGVGTYTFSSAAACPSGSTLTVDMGGISSIGSGSGGTGSSGTGSSGSSYTTGLAVTTFATGLSNPSQITADSQGNLYAANYNSSTVSKISPSGTVTTFATGIRGTGIVADGSDNLYVADYTSNTVKKITPAGVVTTLATGLSQPQGIAIDSKNNLYVSLWGDSSIKKVTLSGVVTSFATGFYGPSGLTVDSSDNLFVTDAYNHAIRKVTPQGAVTLFAGTLGAKGSTDATGSSARFNKPFGITADTTGNLYVSDTDNHTIRKITAAGVVTTLAGYTLSSGNTDNTGSLARFNGPLRPFLDLSGNLYIPDSLNNSIRKIQVGGSGVMPPPPPSVVGLSPNSGAAESAASITGTGLAAASFLTSPIINFKSGALTTQAQTPYTWNATNTAIDFTVPGGLAAGIYAVSLSDGSTTPYAAGNFTIPVVGTQMGGARQGHALALANMVSTLAGGGGGYYTDGIGAAAGFNVSSSITTDGTNLYVLDTNGSRVRKVVLATSVVSTLSGATSNNKLYFPTGGVVTDGLNLYVGNAHQIVKIDMATGAQTAFAGISALGSIGMTGLVDGIGTAARFDTIKGITTDGTYLYVLDNYNLAIRRVALADGTVTTLGATGGWVTYSPATPNKVDSRFGGTVSPVAITTDGINLYVSNSSIIRQINIASGAVVNFAGDANLAGILDGQGVSARFTNISSITTDGTSLYVTDVGTATSIRKIDLATATVSSITAGGGTGMVNGAGSSAKFNAPQGITTDGTSLYVADTGNYVIRKLQ